jgi:hypothetical protein
MPIPCWSIKLIVFSFITVPVVVLVENPDFVDVGVVFRALELVDDGNVDVGEEVVL